MKYSKRPLLLPEQLDLLSERGLIVGNRGDAESFLSRVNYYRFSAYCPPFEQRRHQFLPNVRFEQVRDLYELDRRLRLLVMEAIEPIEISIRTAAAYRMSCRYGPFAHSDASNLRPTFDHAGWMRDVLSETERSRETFVSHFRSRYEEYPQLPIWAAVEIMSFGSLSKLYGGLQNEDRRELAARFGLHPSVLGSWLHTLVYIRNICAHHARLWNRELAIAPRLPDKDERWRSLAPAHAKRISSVLFLMNALMTRLPGGAAAAKGWRMRIETLLAENPGVARFEGAMGLPPGWTESSLWRR